MNTIRGSVRRGLFASTLTLGLCAAAVTPAAAAATAPHVIQPNAAAWTVTLTADSYNPLPTISVTLKAVSSVDVGAKGLYLDIFDLDTSTLLNQCSTGTSCYTSVVGNAGQHQHYVAYITDAPGDGAGHDYANSSTIQVSWQTISVTLTIDVHTLAVGGTATLTSVSSADIYHSVFVIQIWDTTDDYPVSPECYNVCTTTVTRPSAGVTGYQARVVDAIDYPQPPPQAYSPVNYVDWTTSKMTLTLTAPAVTHGPETVAATASIDVGPTPYYIEIFDTSGRELAMCGTGSVCTLFNYTPATSPGSPASQLVAFICIDRGLGEEPAAVDDMAVSNTVVTVLQQT
jgi:hypothetical protein